MKLAHHTLATLSICGLALGTPLAHAQDWEFFSTTSPYPQNIPQGSDAPADDEVWVVGNSDFFDPFPQFFSFTFAQRFDGTRWNFVPTPDINGAALYGVKKLPGGDVLAVGSYNAGADGQTLALRYDGSSWQQIDSPTRFGGAAFVGMGQAGDDIWAVGVQATQDPPPSATGQALAARWNGSGWDRYQPEPLVTGGRAYNTPRDVAGVSADDAWAVGNAQQTGVGGFGPTAYITRWQGDRWELYDIGLRDLAGLNDALALASDNVWAVGSITTGDLGRQPLILHWDGSDWTIVDTPTFPDGRAELRAIAARSPTEIYASGTDADADGFPRALMLKYDGTSWERIDVATPTDGEQQWFRTMSVTPSGDVWAMGQYYRPDEQATHVTTQRLSASATCRADLDGDGELTIFDFLAFQNAFDAGDPIADFDGDSELTIFDFLAFQNAFDAGCE
ncbi:MAG: Rax2 family protein [Phycisphaera sp.]|nr:MAG: Rax2 family protein [Phycisphaera sp.]